MQQQGPITQTGHAMIRVDIPSRFRGNGLSGAPGPAPILRTRHVERARVGNVVVRAASIGDHEVACLCQFECRPGSVPLLLPAVDDDLFQDADGAVFRQRVLLWQNFSHFQKPIS